MFYIKRTIFYDHTIFIRRYSAVQSNQQRCWKIKLNSHAGGMVVAWLNGFEIDFVRNPISWSAAWFSNIILKFIFTPIFEIKIHEKNSLTPKKFHFRDPILTNINKFKTFLKIQNLPSKIWPWFLHIWRLNLLVICKYFIECARNFCATKIRGFVDQNQRQGELRLRCNYFACEKMH